MDRVPHPGSPRSEGRHLGEQPCAAQASSAPVKGSGCALPWCEHVRSDKPEPSRRGPWSPMATVQPG